MSPNLVHFQNSRPVGLLLHCCILGNFTDLFYVAYVSNSSLKALACSITKASKWLPLAFPSFVSICLILKVPENNAFVSPYWEKTVVYFLLLFYFLSVLGIFAEFKTFHSSSKWRAGAKFLQRDEV